MIREEVQFTRLTMEQPNLKVTWEVPYTDVNMNDMFDAFKTILVGMTFLPSQAEESIDEFKEEINETD
jgi:hypothetical protein